MPVSLLLLQGSLSGCFGQGQQLEATSNGNAPWRRDFLKEMEGPEGQGMGQTAVWFGAGQGRSLGVLAWSRSLDRGQSCGELRGGESELQGRTEL